MKTYRINEIFYSLQGEGFFTGTAAVFVRFSGCNLKCPFCDTNHSAFKEMTGEEIEAEVGKYPARHVVLTGGEPSLWIGEELVGLLNGGKRTVAIETNGTRPLPRNLDWVTLSPKFEFTEGKEAELAVKECDELKVVYRGQELSVYGGIKASHRFLQPCDSGNAAINRSLTEKAVAACLENPEWRLSLQVHKILRIR